jgi:hypothetical protein
VAHAFNPSYSGGRDQEDHGSQPAWANISQDPISEKQFTTKGWSVSRCRPEFKSTSAKTNKQTENTSRLVNDGDFCVSGRNICRTVLLESLVIQGAESVHRKTSSTKDELTSRQK